MNAYAIMSDLNSGVHMLEYKKKFSERFNEFWCCSCESCTDVDKQVRVGTGDDPRFWLGGRYRHYLLWMVVFFALPASCEWLGPPSLHITAEEFRFTPTQIEWPPFHPVRLLIRNQGRERHVFHSPALYGPNTTVRWHQPKMAYGENHAIILDPGQSIELTITLAPGLYPFRCWIKGHTGMEGVIFVKDPFENK